MSIPTENQELLVSLERLSDATDRLTNALRKADAQAIFDAVVEQLESLKQVEACKDSSLEGAQRETARNRVRFILDANAHNQDLSRNGLRAIRQSLAKFLPVEHYEDDGSMPTPSAVGRLSTSA
jgi:hypothetical protein